VVAIGQIFPQILKNKYRIKNKNIFGFYLFLLFICNKTYQERRREGPYDVLATLNSRVPNPTPNGER
tara:strand:- start:418 stop:618 length:201 start_codon:yes stop_codon:yes gene_type:complete